MLTGTLPRDCAAVTLSSAVPALADITPVYFGNGCFWGRQKDYVDTEQKLGRTPDQSTALVGYAGGRENSKPTCYYYNSPDTLYEKQGHAEVVQVRTVATRGLPFDHKARHRNSGTS